jgi:signal transduction histidine kinase
VDTITILLIEARPETIQTIRRLLETSSSVRYQVEAVTSLAVGLTRLERRGIDIILFDLDVPDQRGLDSIGLLQARSPGVPVVVLTDCNGEQQGIDVIQHGAQDCLARDQLDGPVLSRTLRFAVQRQRGAEELRHHLQSLEETLKGRNLDLLWVNRLLHQEIDRRQRAEQEALELALEREKMRILRNFVRAASHDFRTPVSTINTSLYLLQKLSEPAGQKQQIKVIERQVERLTDLIEGLLTVLRLDDDTGFAFRRADINSLIKDVEARVYPLVSAKQLTLTLNLAPDIPALMLDETEFTQAVTELIENAVRYTAQGGIIYLHTQHDADHVVVTVQDTGTGIDPDDLPHIFEPLYRADKARSAETGGIGLGLSIVEKIVKAHGGEVTVSSRVGEGSTFHLIVPVRRDQATD